jgi:hypothetical protein
MIYRIVALLLPPCYIVRKFSNMDQDRTIQLHNIHVGFIEKWVHITGKCILEFFYLYTMFPPNIIIT